MHLVCLLSTVLVRSRLPTNRRVLPLRQPPPQAPHTRRARAGAADSVRRLMLPCRRASATLEPAACAAQTRATGLASGEP